MENTFSYSPFYRYLPVRWEFHQSQPPVYSITHRHGLSTRFRLHNLADPINHGRRDGEQVLISYEVRGRQYNLYTIDDLNKATYAFDESGMANMRGDLAERVSRRVMKRFLQRFDQHRGRLGGLFDKRFDPKHRENYVVAHNKDYVLKIGHYPNMILLKRTGEGNWGYQHVTDIDGLFDYRYLGKRHLIILESKTGKIDVNAPRHLPDSVQTVETPVSGSYLQLCRLCCKASVVRYEISGVPHPARSVRAHL